MQTGISQVELRWTDEGQSGFSIIASSESCQPSSWAQRLQPIARPPGIPQPVTVVYKVFDSDAVIVYRIILTTTETGQQDTAWGSGLPASTQSSRSHLVARALIGPVELLSPELALAASLPVRTNVPGALATPVPGLLTPIPGKVALGEPLPTLRFEELDAVFESRRAELDRLACDDPDLESVIAGALTTPTMALTLQLPEQELGSKSAVALLWGLWRTGSAFLAEFPQWQWSFSTGEAPTGDGEQVSLPHMIVQGLPSPDDAPPSVQRRENIIQPRAGLTSLEGDEAAAAAAVLLTRAYRHLPIDDFRDRVQKICDYRHDLADRLAAVVDELSDASGTVSALGIRPVSGIVSKSGSAEDISDLDREDDLTRQTSSQAKEGSRSRQSTGPKHRVGPTPLHNDAFPHEFRSGNTLTVPGMEYPRNSYAHLFAQLAQQSDIAEVALDQIRHKHEEGDKAGPKERGQLRAIMFREGWFVGKVDRLQTHDVGSSVAVLLDISVKPDISDPALRSGLVKELLAWVMNECTPAIVIIALDDIAFDLRDYELHGLLIQAMGYHWRRDHGRYGLLSEPAKTPEKTGNHLMKVPWWVPFKGEHTTAARANALVLLCVAQLGIFALLLVILV